MPTLTACCPQQRRIVLLARTFTPNIPRSPPTVERALTQEVRHQVRRSRVSRRLQTIPGIGWILGYVILVEIGRIKRFKNPRHLASYSLLPPMAHDSGEEHPDEPSPAA
ncbi:MAG: transposase [Planctomycetota bacterium]